MKYRFAMTIFIAIFIFANFVNAQQTDDGISYVYAKKLFNDKLYELAAEQFHQFAEQNFEHPKAPESLLMAGKCFYNINDFKNAIKQFTYLITRYPAAQILDEAQFNLAQSFEQSNQIEFAARAYHQVQIFYPKSTFALKSLLQSAKMYRLIGDFDSAEEVFYEVMEQYPDAEEALQARLFLAEIFIESKKYNRAQIELNRLLIFTKEGIVNASAILSHARIENIVGRTQEAENIYLDLIAKYEKLSKAKDIAIGDVINKARFELAEILSSKGFYEQSNKFLNEINTIEQNTKYLFLRADNDYNLSFYQNALAYYEKIRSNSTDSLVLIQAHFRIGLCQSKLKNFHSANQSLFHVIELCQATKLNDELCQKCYIEVSNNFLNLKNPPSAIKYLNDYLVKYKADVNSTHVKYKIAVIFENDVKNFERAIRAYYDFIDEYPHSKFVDDAQMSLARCFESKSDYIQAANEYQNLLTLYPASEHVSIAQKRMEYIANYEMVNKNILNQFASLMQQFIAAQSETSSDFKLGMIYFNEIKDFSSAITYFKKALILKDDSNSADDELLFYLSRSYHLLSLKLNINQGLRQTYADSALQYYSKLIDKFAQSNWVDDAAFYKIELVSRDEFNGTNNRQNYQISNLLTNFKYNYVNSEYLDQVNLMLGEMLLKKGINNSIDSLDIANCFNAVITNSPDNNFKLRAEFNLGILLHKCGDDSAALKNLAYIINKYPGNYFTCRATYSLAEIYESIGEYALAEKFLHDVIENFYYSSFAEDAELFLGRLKIKQSKYSEAVKIYDKLYCTRNISDLFDQTHALNDQAQFEQILYNYGSATFRVNDQIKSIQLFHEYLNLYPSGNHADELLNKLAKIYNTNLIDDQNKSINYLKQLLKYFPASVYCDSAKIKLGDLYFNKGEYATANEYYDQAIQAVGGNNPYPISQKVIGLYRSDQVSKANELFNQFKKQYKSDEAYISNLMLEKGDYHLKNKDFKAAESIFKDVRSDFKKTSNGAKAEYLLGRLYFILNKDEEALEIMTKIFEKYPDDRILAEVYISLGNFYYLQVKQVDNAMLAFKKVLELKNVNEFQIQIAINNLIRCYGDLRLREQALAMTKSYIERFPGAEDLFEKEVMIGILYYELNEYDRALSWLRKLKHEADFENEPRIQYWIGECYFGKGDFKRAVSEYLKIVYLSKPTKLNWRVTAQFQAGNAYLKAGDPQNAKAIFNRIVLEQGADSVFGKPAQKKIEEIDQMLTDSPARI